MVELDAGSAVVIIGFPEVIVEAVVVVVFGLVELAILNVSLRTKPFGLIPPYMATIQRINRTIKIENTAPMAALL